MKELAISNHRRLRTALRDWRHALGDAWVIDDPGELAAAGCATFATHQRVIAILRPAHREEVQACVRIANRHRLRLYVTSAGKNWGYGSRVPVCDESVLLDLGRMQRIVDFDEKLAYVTVEPGVTFRRLAAFLRRRGAALCVPAVGGSFDASIVGNAVERGISADDQPERADFVCGLEVVLPTGDVIETGFARIAGARAAPLHRHAIGPSVDGLFLQSNLGIVTRLTLWLAPAPALRDLVELTIPSRRGLPRVVDVLQQLRLRGPLRGNVQINSRYRMLAVLRQYPWAATQNRVPVPARVASALWDDVVPPWIGFGSMGFRDRAQRAAERRLVRDALAKVDSVVRFTPVEDPSAPGSDERVLAMLYWRKRGPVPKRPDPDRDRCGVLFCSPIVPFDGREVDVAVRIIERTLTEHGFDPALSVHGVSPRVVIMPTLVLFDRDAAGEDERALECHAALVARLAARGFHPGRASVATMGALPAATGSYPAFLTTLKQALDPNRVLAPGRYEL